MAYQHQVAVIPLGIGGLHTDDQQSIVPPTDLIYTKNISIGYNQIEKDPGSEKFCSTALPDAVYGFLDFWPNVVTQRLLAVCADGKVYKFNDISGYSEVTPDSAAPATLLVDNQVTLVAGGAESQGRNRKCFIFTGNNPVQVISADGTTRSNISAGATDWSGFNQPKFGLIHRNRLVAFGNKNDPHRFYMSLASNHEDFTTTSLQFSVFPGEGERLISATVYKGRLFLFKYPNGLYYLDDASADTADWAIRKLSSSFGAASEHSIIQVLDDIIVGNAVGSITSLKAVQAFGDVQSADILANLRCEKYMRNTTSYAGTNERHAIYYESRKTAYFAYRGAGNTSNNRLLVMDFSTGQPRVTWTEKDQPNCLGLRKDILGVERPMYGAGDGYIYKMDMATRNVNGVGNVGRCTPALAGLGAGNLSNGTYTYKITAKVSSTESTVGPASTTITVSDNSTNGQVALSSIWVDPNGVATARNIYRNTIAAPTVFKLVGTINDNTTTTYTDNVADASLGATAPTTSTITTGAYTGSFQTPHMDFGYGSRAVAEANKIFQFLEFTFTPVGNWNMSVEVFIDEKYIETITFNMTDGAPLDEFILDTDRLGGEAPRSIRKPLHGMGRRISLRASQDGVNQNFKALSFNIYYKIAGQAQKAVT